MLCANCGKEMSETSKRCENCGAEIVEEISTANNPAQESPWGTGLKTILEGIVGIVIWGAIIFYGISWFKERNAEEGFLETVYQEAVEEVSSHWKDQDSIKIGEYEKEYVNLQEWDYYDFGYGTLRYGRYEVTVPIEIEIWGEDYEDTMKVNVYYYTSNQNVSDGIDTSVEDHLYTPNIFEDPREGIWQDAD